MGEIRKGTITETGRIRIAAFAVVGEAVLDGTAPQLLGHDVDPDYHSDLESAIRSLGLGSTAQAPDAPTQQRPSTVMPLVDAGLREEVLRRMTERAVPSASLPLRRVISPGRAR